jgi:hypothetical protein
VTVNLVERYSVLDETSSSSALEAADIFLKEELTAYAQPLMIAIKGISDYQQNQFSRNLEWVSPLLSTANLFNDRAIRTTVKLVTDNQITPILISYSRRRLPSSSNPNP